jgi:WhiB family redox-sensing transcriptional regulator
MAHGRCRETDPELWFPQKGDNSLQARRICQTCPVREQCLDWALRHNEIGVWGGTSEIARRRILTARRKAAA